MTSHKLSVQSDEFPQGGVESNRSMLNLRDLCGLIYIFTDLFWVGVGCC